MFTRSGIVSALVCTLLALAIRTAIGSSSVAVQASKVLGQPDFTHSAANFIDGKGVNFPGWAAIDRSVTPNRLYVVDTGNNRVLGWSSIAALLNGSPADLVLGQPDFASTNCNLGNSAPTASTLCFGALLGGHPAGGRRSGRG